MGHRWLLSRTFKLVPGLIPQFSHIQNALFVNQPHPFKFHTARINPGILYGDSNEWELVSINIKAFGR